MTQRSEAVVLVSGGLDSATTLAIARDEGFKCHALSFDYGQRHRVELLAAERIAHSLAAAKHFVIHMDLRAYGGSALTDDSIAVPKDRIGLLDDRPSLSTPCPGGEGSGAEGESEIPITYVPARNTIFLSFALGYAEVHNIRDIFIGVNAIDFSGYPDCRPVFIRAFEQMANLATRIGVESHEPDGIRIHTPLIHMTKAQIIRRGVALGVDYGLTTSCYDPDNNGKPCGSCDSCRLRAAGFVEAGIKDPAG